MLELIKKVIVVIGCQRSGTTLTAQILGAHPRAFMIDEPDGVYDWANPVLAGTPVEPAEEAALLLRASRRHVEPRLRVRGRRDGLQLCAGIDTLVPKAPNLSFHSSSIAQHGGTG